MSINASFCQASLAAILLHTSAALADVAVKIGYLEQALQPPPILYNLEEVANDEALSGARLGLKDNVTTGKFLKHTYVLVERVVAEGGDLASAARDLLAQTPFVVVNASAADLTLVADLPEASRAVLFNAGSADVELRETECRANVSIPCPLAIC
jgi:ABC transporter substrate binding protein (PQQ-dependent alcohol dehydrogenase system)